MYRILIIEDSLFMCQLLRKHLAGLDMEVIGQTGSCTEGIQLFSELNPDILIIDYSLPEMTGIQLAAEILKRNVYAKIIFLLPARLMNRAQEMMAMGIKGVLAKPFYPEKLQSTMIEVAFAG